MKFNRKVKLSFMLIILLIVSACEPPEDESSTANEERIVPVEVMNVTTKSIDQKVQLSAVLQPVNEVDILAEVSGEVLVINKNVGDRITTSSLLAQIDDVIPQSQYEQAKSQVLSAENNLEISKTNLESDEILFANKDISKLAYDNSRLAVKSAEAQHLSALASLSVVKKSFEDTKINSPIDGIVARRFVDIGTMATIGMPLFRVVNISELKAEVSVPQEYVNRIKVGSEAEARITALGGGLFRGMVKRISPQADEVTGGYVIEVNINNTRDYKIKAGMTTSISMILNSLENQIVVPDYAVLVKNQSNYVYLVSGDRAKMTKVEIGETLGGQTVIHSGLNAGDKIVVVGMKNLGVDTKVSIDNTL